MTKHGPAGEVSDVKQLSWCVGKFAYVRGASQPIHFMELKSFIIDDAVDFSHLFYLRALRARMAADEQLDEALKKWMEGTAVKLLAEVVVVGMQASGAARLVELYPGVGLTAEYVQLLLERDGRRDADGRPQLAEYVGCGPDSERNKLLVLHADQPARFSYLREVDAPSFLPNCSGSVAVLNQNHTVRYPHAGSIDIKAFLASYSGPAVLAIRCTGAQHDERHTSVKGRVIELPALERVLDECRRHGHGWQWRFLPAFDAGYFLPDGGGPTGLLIALRAESAAPVDRFQPLG